MMRARRWLGLLLLLPLLAPLLGGCGQIVPGGPCTMDAATFNNSAPGEGGAARICPAR